MNHPHRPQQFDLHELARRAMRERGLEPDFPPDAMQQVEKLAGPAQEDATIQDLRGLAWCSIDNDDSRDLDQLTVAKSSNDASVRILVAIADVDAVVHPGSPVDDHAHTNTTSVYTAGGIFPMLPERLSTDLTSLNAAEDRLAVIVDMTVGADGAVAGGDIYRARVRNHAKLAYNALAAWLEGQGPLPPAAAAVT